MSETNGLRIALSPVQLAATLSEKSISEGETLSNRLWGGLGLAGGVVEMFGAGVMCVVPEPTMLTKAGSSARTALIPSRLHFARYGAADR